MPTVYEQVYDLVRKIPHGKVLTYGLISHLLSGRLSAQGVGWALRSLCTRKSQTNHSSIPWHRVVNSLGGISTAKNPNIAPGLQRHLLEKEGIIFDQDERINLQNYLWHEGLS